MWSWPIIVCLIAVGLSSLHTGAAALFVGRFARRKAPARIESPSVTILKPLCGDEPGLMENLASFCAQDYSGAIQIIFGTQDPGDPAIDTVKGLLTKFPGHTLELVVDSRLHGVNRKVSNLVNMAACIRHEVVILADSDIRVGPGYVAGLIAELERSGVNGVTCLYHGLGSQSIWSRLSALGIDTHFLPNVIVGLALRLARPCLGSTIALRRETLNRIGGMEVFANDMADDYVLGEALRSEGGEVAVPSFLIGHVCGECSWGELWGHELRWARTIRSIDPVGHAASIITHGLPWALMAVLLGGGLAATAAVFLVVTSRILLCMRIERAFGLVPHPYWLLPFRDLLSFTVFIASFIGRSVTWKGHSYRMEAKANLVPKRRSASP
ncbi:bacteriohopanetetrol glucosamine biosynthesis glycosyltransferase HpnI [Microvirga alba]|uniref:Bacteriohopanetetrol glucosamine biosynthesis glycosyltransferase HpnI n=1 Tax=Microvirga alba TaxID=2791025 RepID=A0A931FPT3_9HYPH|nr:bacteriohopanetetrol glucosamine biosynthesis glycosyltransferase HpnI [Microvirga alba]MBF9235294.1 bacteriohopanetetrol glucosamine biosynthesis glycosyltransferase HpnI [Microvirga alba]